VEPVARQGNGARWGQDYGALVLLGAGTLLLTVAAIAFYRTPLTF